MKLTVIIVNYNVQHFLEQCLHSVRKASQNVTTEIYVVDNNSVDGSVQMVKDKFPEVLLIENKKNTGFSFANNQAMRVAKGEYVLLLNPDTVVEEDTFSKVVAFMNAHPDAGGLGVKMLDGKGNFLPESKRGLPTPSVAFYKIFGFSRIFPKSKTFGKYHLGFLDKDKTNEVEILSGAFMLMRKAALNKVGLLDETFFMYGEDIDLSYRIILGGYKNYYFPETRIIHYKGESTKKSSINYVFVFYKAMVIFAQKHFSQNNAKLFSFLINIAIYLRAGAAIAVRFIKSIALPALDFGIIMLGLIFIKEYYEKHFRFLEGGSYSQSLIAIAFPIYICMWMFTVYLSGGYDKPIRLFRIIRGILVGTGVILIGYALLPEAYRFSRAIILLGAGWVLFSYLISRLAFHVLGLKTFNLNPDKSKRIAIIGTTSEFERVSSLLKQTTINASLLGFVSADKNETQHKDHLGNIEQIGEVIEIYKINEVIFCSRDISSQGIIDYMHTLVSADVDFKIAPPESLSIIGSNSIDTAGDLYIIDVNSISKPKNKRNKRFVDITVSFLLLILSPFLIFIQENKSGFIKNLFYVLAGRRSWVGYGNEMQEHLPKIKTSILSPADAIKNIVINPETRNRLNLAYSKDYKVENDLNIIRKSLKKLGN
ncbi:MAG: putative glycosyltransferase [Bacteroidetes bacterium]|nr:putative glycosyltransferase [Bacteroidota bacterium]